MADLKAFHAELQAQHAALTKAFESAQVAAEAAWADSEAKAAAVVAFREEYGHVLKALDAGDVKVG
jgi:hypothetical protein